MAGWPATIMSVMPPHLRDTLRNVSEPMVRAATELRLRKNQPLLIVLKTGDYIASKPGTQEVYRCTGQDIDQVLQLITKYSVYNLEQELKSGFITIQGGHRIGLAGQVMLNGSKVKAMKHFSSLNVRICREVKHCADAVMPYLLSADKSIYNTLVIAPPRAGKTTLLRDIARQLSSGSERLGFTGVQVGIVDERSEIAACQQGTPTMDVGHRTDVLDGCLKAEGMLMLIRSMSPQLLVTDELGREEDATAVLEAVNAGVSVVASLHAASLEEAERRPYVGRLIAERVFDRLVVLRSQPCPGTIGQVLAADKQVLWSGVRVCG